MADTQDRIIRTDYSEIMQKNYIDYAMSVIVSRALPDVRDGLKPVQRRVLYDMYELGTRWDRPYRKSARIVGDTMGKYHPHGDSSIYESLVVMAQNFKKGRVLVDGHGNFGSIEGDGAAAMRYTEARLEKFTQDVFLADLDKDMLMLSAVLVDAADEPFSTYDVGWEVLTVDDVQKKGVDRGEGVPPYDLVEYHATEVTRKIVSYGSMDLRNPEAGYDPATAVKRAEPIEADTWYDYTIWLQPNFYTVQPGHRLEVYILPFCGFSSTDFALELSTPEQLVEYGVDPASIVPFHHDYRFTVNGGSVDIPVVSSGK